MAAAKTYRVKSLTYKTVATTGLMGVNQDDSADVLNLHTDNAETITATFVQGIMTEVTAETTDLSILANSSYAMGSAGSLVVVEEQRAEGKGAVGAADKTATYANAVVSKRGRKSGPKGESLATITWTCADPAGLTPVVHS